jgi:hypothetical protein
MPRNLFRVWSVPRSLISQRVGIPPVLFTRIGVEANSGRVSLVRGIAEAFLIKLFLKVFEEPEAVFSPKYKRTSGGICWRRSSCHLGKFDASMGWYTVRKCGPKRVCHRGSACLLRVGMIAKHFDQTFLKFERKVG